MQRAQVFPKVVLAEREEWLYDGYRKIDGLTQSGSRNRGLYERDEIGRRDELSGISGI